MTGAGLYYDLLYPVLTAKDNLSEVSPAVKSMALCAQGLPSSCA